MAMPFVGTKGSLRGTTRLKAHRALSLSLPGNGGEPPGIGRLLKEAGTTVLLVMSLSAYGDNLFLGKARRIHP